MPHPSTNPTPLTKSENIVKRIVPVVLSLVPLLASCQATPTDETTLPVNAMAAIHLARVEPCRQ